MKAVKLFGLALLVLPCILVADFITPEEAGFRHCALIYHHNGVNADYFKPMLVKYDGENPTSQPGFDMFLFLSYSIPNGKRTEMSPTDMADWQWIIDDYFGENGHTVGLAQAIRELRGEVGEPSGKIRAAFCVPWINPEVTEFGDVDGDGVSEDLSTSEGREAAIRWYTASIIKELAKYPEIELWGFYLMREGVSDSERYIARELSNIVHDLGYRMLWIPYYNAAGYEKWREAGFDAAFFQSNWMFTPSQRNRLWNTADRAKRYDAGIELELYSTTPTPRQRRIFWETMETGTLSGFQDGACAYYFGDGFNMHVDKEPENRALYAAWMDFVAGKPITAPPVGEWEVDYQGDCIEVVYRLDAPGFPVAVDLTLDTDNASYFTGIAELFGRRAGGDWRPLAWKVCDSPDEEDVRYQSVQVKLLPEELDELKFVLRPNREARPWPSVMECNVQLDSAGTAFSKSLNRKYHSSVDEVAAPLYPDSTGFELSDGVIGGSWENYVGWFSNDGRVTLNIEFAGECRFDEIRVYSLKDGNSSIYPPAAVETRWGNDFPSSAYDGFGALPEELLTRENGFRYLADKGYVQIRLPHMADSNFVTLLIDPHGWFFASEIEFYLNGTKCEVPFSYDFEPVPSNPSVKRDAPGLYEDPGDWLTDGEYSSFYSDGAVGFVNEAPRKIAMDLGSVMPVNEIRCYTIGGGHAGILAPAKITAWISADRKNWVELPAVAGGDENTGANLVKELKIPCDGREARFIMLEFTAESGAWCFVTEIAVY